MNKIVQEVALFKVNTSANSEVNALPIYLPGTPEMEPMMNNATRITEYKEVEFTKLPVELKDITYLKANAKEIEKSIKFLTETLSSINDEISLLHKQAYIRSLNDI